MTETSGQRLVENVMTTQVVSVDAVDPLDEALDVMVEHGVSFVPALDSQGRCVGVLSITRLLELARIFGQQPMDFSQFTELPPSLFIEELSQPGFGGKKVEELMTAPPVGIGPTASLAEAARAMVEYRMHRLLVLDSNHRVLGVVSTMDLLRAFAAGQ